MQGLRVLRGFIAMVFVGTAFAAPVHLRCEYRVNPLGIDVRTPHLSWQSDSTERNWKQSGYEILVASSRERLQSGQADVWDSGKIQSDNSVEIRYAGAALESGRRYYWKVRVWETAGHLSESTEEAWWETGLLQPRDWTAKWIGWTNPEDAEDRAAIRWIWFPAQDPVATTPNSKVTFATTLKVSSEPQSAALFVAVHGSYRARVNGHEVGDKSHWESFDRRDISAALVVGKNRIEVEVTTPPPPEFGVSANGKTSMGGFAALLKLTNANGSVVRRGTERGWDAQLENSGKWRRAQIAGEQSARHLGDPGPLPQPAAYLRRTFETSKTVRRARLYVTALGSYRIFLNGSRIGTDELTPGFTDYRKRVLYQTYDVTNQVIRGRNAIAALLGDGWYGSPLTWLGFDFFKPPNRFLAQLELEYDDGSQDTVVSDGSWKAAVSPIVESQIYSGEFYDARHEQAGWNNTKFDDSSWAHAFVGEAPEVPLSGQLDTPVQTVDRILPKSVTPATNGVYVFDMGQNLVGWATLKVKGAAGTKIRLRFAEVLKPDGGIYTANLRNADATDTYILKGGGEETFTPHFTFHGFRYVEITGYPGIPPLDAVRGEVISSLDRDPSAKLTTSSDLVNRMYGIGLWGQRGNFVSIPTDCPQRDERLGWMGDAGVFWRTGSYNFDIAAFSQKFAADIADAQTSEGAFTNVSPNTVVFTMSENRTEAWTDGIVGAPGWGDAGVIVPWTTWVQYGDKAVIENNWDAMERWMQFIQSRNPDFIRTNGVGPNYADWLAPDANTDKSLLATAYWALIANMMSQMAHAIGRDEDAMRYRDVDDRIRGAFQKTFIKEDGTVGTGTQTSYVVALYTKMAPESLEPRLVENLVKDIESRDWHLSTGFLGTPFLLFTLADHGRTDVAYRLLLNDTYPSWGYMLSKGATTWWERWNGDTGDPSMNSYNHYAFGSVIAWVYRYAAGIDTTLNAPGFKEIVVHPHLDSRMPRASAEYESVYGKITTAWEGSSAGPFRLRITIPANTSAKVYLPVIQGAHLTESGNAVESLEEGDALLVRVGSGTYNFEVK